MKFRNSGKCFIKWIIQIFILFTAADIYSQQGEIQPDDLKEIYEYIELNNIELAPSAIQEFIDDMRRAPLDLNKVSLKELNEIPLLSTQIALSIIKYREITGKFYSVRELQSVDGVDEKTYKILSKFFMVSVESNPDIAIKDKGFQGRILRKDLKLDLYTGIVSDEKNYSEYNYLGSSIKLVNRVKMNFNNKFLCNLAFAKDKGETNVADHVGIAMQINDIYYFNRLILGDYKLQFAQGLVLSSDYALGKGGDPILPIRKRGEKLKLSGGSSQFGSLRGIAAEINFLNFSVIPFYSFKNLDANVDSSGFISSIYSDGYHRTESEIAKKNSSSVRMFGNIITYDNNILKAELLYCNILYQNDIRTDYIYGIRGREFNYLSLGTELIYNNYLLFLEASNKIGAGTSFNIGSILSISKYIEWASGFRNYALNYNSPLANSFGENSDARNETGYYSGLNFKIKTGTLKTYFDIYNHNFPNAISEYPHSGKDLMIAYESAKIKNLNLSFIFKYKEETDEVSTFNNQNLLKKVNVNMKKYFGRLVLSKEYSHDLILTLKVDYLMNKYDEIKISERGLVSSMDLDYQYSENLKLRIKTTFYNTDNYESRVYTFENNIPSYMYLQPLYGNGIRWSVYFRYKLFDYAKIYLKYYSDYKISPDDKIIQNGLKHTEQISSGISCQIDFLL